MSAESRPLDGIKVLELGQILAGPLVNEEGLVIAEIDPGRVAEEKMTLDVCGHYARPDVFNHNIETVPRLYRQARPGAAYQGSLDLIQAFGEAHPEIPTKSGLMVGLGESMEEIEAAMRDLRAHGCRMLTIGQYLAPSRGHLPVQAFIPPEQFEFYRSQAMALGFSHVESGPLVRSSYLADQQFESFMAAGQNGSITGKM